MIPLGIVASARRLPASLRYTGVAWYEADAVAPDSYAALNDLGMETATLTGNTGYARQGLGTPVDPQAQSRMRRCVVRDDATGVRYYLDCDDSTLIAGTWSGGATQGGWVRVHEGHADPVRPIPGETPEGLPGLRAGVAAYAAGKTYAPGARVLHGGSLWDSLAHQQGVTPAPGVTSADLTGGDGQIMVEIPPVYYRWTYTSEISRHEYEVVFDPATHAPFPDLTVEAEIPETVTLHGREFALHPAFSKGGIVRPARYVSAFGVSASDTGNNGSGVLQSIADGTTTISTGISNTNFRTKARNRNTGLTDPSGQADNRWQQYDYWTHHLVSLLLITEYRSLHSQGVLGGGNISGSNYTPVAGRSAPIGNATGNFNGGALVAVTQSGTDGVVYRGIEDPWGSSYIWMDGWNVQNETDGHDHWVSNSPADYAYSTTTGHALIGRSLKGIDGWQYPTALLPGALLASGDGGSTGTYLADGYYANAGSPGVWRVPLSGGPANTGGIAGLAALHLTSGPGGSAVFNRAALSL